MTLLPLMERELRAESRNTFSYWLRSLGASASLIIFAMMIIDARENGPGQGARLFGNLNTALFITIWLLVPLLTADCLSRERREGTLGILFLTPLTARGIVIGKGLIHSLRALTMVLAALPVLAIPLLLGGVTWCEGLMALLLDLGSVSLALAAGLLASAYCRQWNRALLLAEVLAAIFLVGFGILLSLVFGVQVAPHVPGSARGEVSLGVVIGRCFAICMQGDPGNASGEFALGELIFGGAVMCTDVAGMWSEAIKFLPIAATRAWLIGIGEMFLLALIVPGLTVLWVARRVERSRQDRPATTRQLLWRNYLFAPRFWKSLFRSKMRRTLERNPIGWLQQYSTTARVTQWGWCLFIVIAECVLAASVDWYNLEWPQYWLLLLLALSLAASAASSFRRERETGALELILVTPLSVPQIILGRLCGLWRQFLPAFGMLLAVLALLSQTVLQDEWYWRWESYAARDIGVAVLVPCTFATLPIVGLYFSLSHKHFLSAWLSTLGFCLLLPVILPFMLAVALTLIAGSLAFNPFWSQINSFAGLVLLTSGLQIVLALIALTALYRKLRFRKFSLA